MRFSLIPLTLLVLPMLEIAAFVMVGSQIGVLATLGLVVAMSILGIMLMRIQGFGVLTRVRQTMESGGAPGRDLVHGFMILFAGILLVIPGFITDAIGLLLFIPAVRDFGWRFLKDRVAVTTVNASGAAYSRYRTRKDGVVDLDADDYHDVSPDAPRSPSDPRLPPR